MRFERKLTEDMQATLVSKTVSVRVPIPYVIFCSQRVISIYIKPLMLGWHYISFSTQQHTKSLYHVDNDMVIDRQLYTTAAVPHDFVDYTALMDRPRFRFIQRRQDNITSPSAYLLPYIHLGQLIQISYTNSRLQFDIQFNIFRRMLNIPYLSNLQNFKLTHYC